MAEKQQKLSLRKVREYVQSKKSSLLDEISVLSYVTKPRRDQHEIDPRVVTATDVQSHIAEQYRSIRTNISSLSPEKPVRSFLITSSLRGEGKTISACNLATAFSQEVDKKTILVDADMRKSNIHRVFGLKKEPGLSELLTGKADLDDFIKKPVVENLYIISGGKAPANPVELLGSKRMKQMHERLREEFDWVIFDIAPILAVTDAGVLGSILDGSIMVVKAGKTQAVDVERAYSLLLEANAQPIGSILTGVITYIPYYLYRYRYMYSHHYYGT